MMITTNTTCEGGERLGHNQHMSERWRQHNVRRSRFGEAMLTRLRRRVPLVEQELLTLPGYLSSFPVFSGVRSLALCVCFVDCCLSFCTFSSDHCAICSWIDGFWLHLWYLQTLLISVVSRYTARLYYNQFIYWLYKDIRINMCLIRLLDV